MTSLRGTVVAPAGVHVANPAFDVTPHRYVTAIVTEHGIVRPSYAETLRQICKGYQEIGKQSIIMDTDVVQAAARHAEETMGKEGFRYVSEVVANCKMLALELEAQENHADL